MTQRSTSPFEDDAVCYGSDDDDRLRSSITSTRYYYFQEPTATLLPRILPFALRQLWPDAQAVDISVKYLKGGSFNRIISLTRCQESYILRIPRCLDDAHVDRDAASICFLNSNTPGIPVPAVITFDHTKDNYLEAPYMVQSLIQGTSLKSIYSALDHTQKCNVARELGLILRRMLQTRSSDASYISFPPGQESLHAPFYVAPIHTTHFPAPIPYSDSTKKDEAGAYDLFVSSFHKHKEEERKIDCRYMCQYFDALEDIASDMNLMGLFDDTPNCLAHLDFYPRNIMVNSDSHSGELAISAVLDWDSAIFAPMFVSCAPPMWIWAQSDDEKEDVEEWESSGEPKTEQDRKLKTIFEDAAGSDYLRFANSPHYRLARRLFRYAVYGAGSSDQIRGGIVVMRKWEELTQDDTEFSICFVRTLFDS